MRNLADMKNCLIHVSNVSRLAFGVCRPTKFLLQKSKDVYTTLRLHPTTLIYFLQVFHSSHFFAMVRIT